MKAEIIAVGSELLLGQIVNTNAQYLSKKLAELGIDVYFHTVVGDNPIRLEESIQQASKRADLLLFTGGLGPTADDCTKETIAAHLGVDLVQHEPSLNKITAYFEHQEREMTINNRKQSLVLEGATVFFNEHGMAPGMALAKEGKTFILLPGPPHEMKPMFRTSISPYLKEWAGHDDFIHSKVLRFFGIGEAALETKISSLLERQSNPTIAPLATPQGVTLRLTAKAATLEQANQLILPVEKEIRNAVGEFLYGVNEETLAGRLFEMLVQHQLTIAAAESLTAGLFTATLADVPGTSQVLAGGLTVYSLQEKAKQLGIDEEELSQHGVVSEWCAKAMARQVQRKFSSSIGVGLTGVAGPDPLEGQSVGTVWLGFAIEDEVFAERVQLSGLRQTIREKSVQHAYLRLIQYLKERH